MHNVCTKRDIDGDDNNYDDHVTDLFIDFTVQILY